MPAKPRVASGRMAYDALSDLGLIWPRPSMGDPAVLDGAGTVRSSDGDATRRSRASLWR
jgi:hypothetical protein